MNTITTKPVVSIVLCLAGLSASSHVNAQNFTSGVKQTSLIELYTSEGCSSCPPAERYLNSLKNHPKLWERFIPVALHVDYWDYLGWQDRFASARHTQRQRQFARVNQQNTIYTPGFFVNGRPWRPGLFGGTPELSEKRVGELYLKLDGNMVAAKFEPTAKNLKPEVLTIAVLGMGMKSSIKAGEREGGAPTHDFVLLNHAQHYSKNNEWSIQLPKFAKQDAVRYALVAWVSSKGTPVPYQAVGGFIE